MKKALSALTISAVLSQGLYAGSLESIGDRISSMFDDIDTSEYSTDGASWHDPTSGGHYFAAPRGGFRFSSRVASLPMLASFRAPDIEAGCGGWFYDNY